MTMDPALLALIGQLAQRLRERGWMMASAESCTGGLIAGACTELSGSSDWFERGFVTYPNRAKTELLGVDATLIDDHGAVSEPVARAMAVGAVERSGARCAVAVTGVAGPTGGTPAKPVRLWFRELTLLQKLAERKDLKLDQGDGGSGDGA